MTNSGADAAMTRLETAECWRLLQHAELGRLAMNDALGAPDVYPVNFVAFEGALYLRTARGSKLTRITAHPVVALECDGEEAGTLWSVVVRGSAHALRDGAELAASGVAELLPWAPGEKPFALKLTPHSVTGRRFPKTTVPPPESSAALQVAEPPPHDEAHPHGRALPPVVIPGGPPPELFHPHPIDAVG